jgi:hypothetical protein
VPDQVAVNHLPTADDEESLVRQLSNQPRFDAPVSTILRTDRRVIARVTDGIYRQPSSALRELVSNAYDADATQVVIKTDPPRFGRITVEDNGLGMSAAALAHLLYHIGGSAKRTSTGYSLGITSPSDPRYSPGGRRLIGKIGIGLFSVSQLTHAFQIITKVHGDTFRTVASILLRQYSDEDLSTADDLPDSVESGKVLVWQEKASDVEAHGTTIVLTQIRPQARDTLRSKPMWDAVLAAATQGEPDDSSSLRAPLFHIGSVDPTDKSQQTLCSSRTATARVPWEEGARPSEAFANLVEAAWGSESLANANPQLENLFDTYLQSIWNLSLSLPLPYVEGHLFDEPLDGWANAFLLSNRASGAADAIPEVGKTTFRERLGLTTPSQPQPPFQVLFDDVALSHPIKYRDLPTTAHKLKKPLVFIGKCREEFLKMAKELSGGPLEFEAYLFWTPKVSPVDHQGALVRIHGASGTLFDRGFMRYQVSEQTRLRQTTCEVFVTAGLEAALNIDRESFNTAHPHTVFLTRWLHNALRQLATTQKRLAAEVRTEVREVEHQVSLGRIRSIARTTWQRETDDVASEPPRLVLTSGPLQVGTKEDADTLVFQRSRIVAAIQPGRSTARSKDRQALIEGQVEAISQVLASFGVLEHLSSQDLERLLRAVYEILSAGE